MRPAPTIHCCVSFRFASAWHVVTVAFQTNKMQQFRKSIVYDGKDVPIQHRDKNNTMNGINAVCTQTQRNKKKPATVMTVSIVALLE